MYIANPIYDVFFKYLLEDIGLAKILIGAIIEEDIVELSVAPQELVVSAPKRYLSVIRLDFKAVIRTQTGDFKTVLIELQKGKISFEILRFRKYLAKNYERKEKITDAHGNITEKTLPIIAIYFLGFELESVKVPVLRASHQYYDVLLKQTIHAKDNFVEQLIHDCFVIQIPHLPTQTQSKLEKILDLFNQTHLSQTDTRFLELPTVILQDIDVQAFVKRLEEPLKDTLMLEQAQAEDELETTLDNMENQIIQKDRIIAEKDNALLEQSRVIAELKAQLNQQKK